jgi:TRAP-type C4-dicarboxylate transport system substrate-binding protein
VLKDQLHDEFNQTFLDVHGLSTYGLYTTFPVNSVADLKGRTIGGSGRNLLWLEGTGAIPISQANPDTYTSIQTKLSEGQLAAAAWGISFKFPEVCGYYINCGLGACPIQPMTANNDFWAALPDEVRNIIQEEAEQWGIRSTQYAADNDEASIEKAREQGCEIIKLTDEAKAKWAESLPNLPDVTKNELGEEGLKIVRRYMEILAEKGIPVARAWTYPIGN